MPQLTDTRTYIKKILESGVIDEMNTTANVAGYETPNAFDGESETEHEKNISPNAERFGYTYPSSKKKKNTVKLESVYATAVETLHLSEGTYKEFKSDDSVSAKEKVNQKIREINRMIYETERLINHAYRLKTETNLNQSHYWKSSKEKLSKIAERVIRLSKKITDLGA